MQMIMSYLNALHSVYMQQYHCVTQMSLLSIPCIKGFAFSLVGANTDWDFQTAVLPKRQDIYFVMIVVRVQRPNKSSQMICSTLGLYLERSLRREGLQHKKCHCKNYVWFTWIMGCRRANSNTHCFWDDIATTTLIVRDDRARNHFFTLFLHGWGHSHLYFWWSCWRHIHACVCSTLQVLKQVNQTNAWKTLKLLSSHRGK